MTPSIDKTRFALILLFVTLGCFHVKAQDPDNTRDSSKLSLLGYLDTYYSYYTDSLGPGQFQKFASVSPRNNCFGLNIAQIGLNYASPMVRGNLTLHYGDIPLSSWSQSFNPVQEANLGIKILKNTWLDAGFFTTHIGTESFLPKNNYLSSLTVATYNEPFYQAGARLSFKTQKIHAELWIVNGYNFFLDANSAKSVGILFRYKLNSNTSLTYTNLLGLESADVAPVKKFRFYQNIFLNTSFRDKLFLIVGGDFGMQTHSVLQDSEETAFMYNAMGEIRYYFNKKVSVTARYEIFMDPEGFIGGIVQDANGELMGYKLKGYAMGVEFRPVKNAYLRAEGRYLQLSENLDVFHHGPSPSKRWEMMITMGFYFKKVLL